MLKVIDMTQTARSGKRGKLALAHWNSRSECGDTGKVLDVFPSSSLCLGRQATFMSLDFFFFLPVHLCFISLLLVQSLPYLTPEPPSSFPSTDTLSLAIFLWPSSPLSLWRLSLVLVVTVFISSILEGLRGDEIHSFVGGVKKKKGSVQYSTLSMVP